MGSGGSGNSSRRWVSFLRRIRARGRGILFLLVGAVTVTLLLAFTLPLITSGHNGLKVKSGEEQGSLLSPGGGKPLLAVIVPFRDRFEELLTFAPFLRGFLAAQGVEHEIWVVNQVDQFRFNRAALINVGFLAATAPRSTGEKVSYMAMHDVDLLPLNDKLSYAQPAPGVAAHLAWLHPKYNYPSFIGGILLLRVEDYARVDGMSNVYWGWGLEDDEFWLRLKQNGIKVTRSEKGLGTGRKNTFRHIHSPKIRPRDRAKCFDQLAKTRKRDRVTGLSNVNYSILSTVHMKIEATPLTVLNVALVCDQKVTPWCLCPPETTPTNKTTQKPTLKI